jgi:hypothetical protein
VSDKHLDLVVDPALASLVSRSHGVQYCVGATYACFPYAFCCSVSSIGVRGECSVTLPGGHHWPERVRARALGSTLALVATTNGRMRCPPPSSQHLSRPRSSNNTSVSQRPSWKLTERTMIPLGMGTRLQRSIEGKGTIGYTSGLNSTLAAAHGLVAQPSLACDNIFFDYLEIITVRLASKSCCSINHVHVSLSHTTCNTTCFAWTMVSQTRTETK